MKNYLRAVRNGPLSKYVTRLGVAGFVFFLAKGLLWLLIPTLLVALR